MKTIYLCGPINGCTDEECMGWRQRAVALWRGPVLDPMRRDYRGRQLENMGAIVEQDKRDILVSDVLLVNYERPSTGTDMEILYAWERGKLVVAVVPEDVIFSPWLYYHTHHISHRLEEALTWIRVQ